MTCPKCGRAIGEKEMLCRGCVAALNQDALRRRQHQPLLLLADGKGEFITHPTPTGEHIQMFGYRVKRAFCGSEKRAGKDKTRRAFYHGERWKYLCEKCRDAVEELLAEAREAEAIREENLQTALKGENRA